MRELEASAAPEAAQAIGCFTYAVRGAVARLAAAMNGIDGLVFTAGIGENSPRVRAEVMAGLGFLGVEPDAEANGRNGPRISARGSRVTAYVLATDEELVIARHALQAAGFHTQAAVP
jgi:acetate kinase